MPLRVSNIRLSIDEPELALPARVAGALQLAPGEIARWRILRKSLDARNKSAISYVYSLEVALADADWATLGSSNLDPTSLLLNLEANVVVQDADFAEQLRAEFEGALAGSQEMAREQPLPGWRGLRGWLRSVLVAWLAQVYLRVAGGGERY